MGLKNGQIRLKLTEKIRKTNVDVFFYFIEKLLLKAPINTIELNASSI